MWEPTGAEHDATFAAFARAHPNASLWMPTNRDDAPKVIMLPDSAERLIMPFQIKDCHACAAIGNAQIGFDFDRSGNYNGTHLVRIIAAKANSQ
jgi:hypothetical protein